MMNLNQESSSWVSQMLTGHRLALARIITKIENRDPNLPQIMKELYLHTGKAQVIGITGPPGAGKSTLVDQITICLREKQKKVAIIAIDPSSPFSGGAILGDRIRMQRHFDDTGVYIRSLGTRGKQGGLSHSTQEVVLALDAAGYDYILVETVGVGQTELDILKLAQTVLVVLVPESGDSIQVMKAGLMEIADLFAVNKSDRPGSDVLVKELKTMLTLSSDSLNWDIPVLKTEALKNKGIQELVKQIDLHQQFLTASGYRRKKLKTFLIHEVLNILSERLDKTVYASFDTHSGEELLQQLVDRSINPYQAADILSNI